MSFQSYSFVLLPYHKIMRGYVFGLSVTLKHGGAKTEILWIDGAKKKHC